MENEIEKARHWLELNSGEGFLSDDEYCPTRDIFQGRLDKDRLILEKSGAITSDRLYVLVAIIGELGNNSFDHNLGKWRDLSGIFHKLDLDNKTVVLADRGQGIFSSIKNVAEDVSNDLEALKVAFTQKLSGRAPEKRGNGLKFVTSVAKEFEMEVTLWSGRACAQVNEELRFSEESEDIKGVLAQIKF